MTKPFVETYLFFGGRCEEALEFYSAAIGAKTSFLMHHKDSPDAHPSGLLQEGFENKVLHATFHIGGTTLMASDGCEEGAIFSGFRLSLAFPAEEDARRAFNALAEGGKVDMPIERTFWSPCFGMLTDRFGIGWMFTVAEEAP